MRTTLTLCAFLAVTLFAQDAWAGRYTKGRTLYYRKCAPCFSMGWKWAPSAFQPRNVNVRKQARTLSATKICTLHRKQTKKIKGPGCYPARMSLRQKTSILVYLKRHLQGNFKKPRLVKLPWTISRKIKSRSRLKARRNAARKRLKNLIELRRLRRRGKLVTSPRIVTKRRR